MRKLILLLALALGTTSAIAVFAATELARVNNKVISLEDLNRQMKENKKFFQHKIPTKKNVLESMINRELGIQEAKKLGLDKDPEVIAKMNTVLYQSLIDQKLSKKFDTITVTDDEVSAYYTKNPEIRTSHIFVQLRPDATRVQEQAALEKIKKIQDVLNEGLKSGKQTFAEVANTYSDGVVGMTGGDIDYQTKDKLDPTYYQAATALKVGAITAAPVRSQFGYHIIKLTGVKELKDVDKGLYKRIIFDEKRNKMYESYMAELRAKAKVSVNQEMVRE